MLYNKHMRNNDLEQMQRDLQKMRNNLEFIKRTDYIEPVNNKKRQAVKKKVNRIHKPKLVTIIKREKLIAIITIVIITTTLVFSSTIFAKSMSNNGVEVTSVAIEKEDLKQVEVINTEENSIKNEEEQKVVFEVNENAIELEDILLENISVLKSKEYVQEIRPSEPEIQYNENPNLPEGEEKVVQEGQAGTKQVTVIKSYENNEFVGESIIEQVPIVASMNKLVDVGTSKFLAYNQVHLKDTMYVKDEIELKKEARKEAESVCKIPKSIDVTLIALSNEEWCKISLDGKEGYIECNDLTSSKVMPEIVELNRVQRIKLSLSENIPLNVSTKMTLEDYKRVLTGNKLDRKRVISDNSEVFYNMDRKYNINGIFLASIAIHESAWGTSTIADNKKNLFGYGAYDRSPYASSFMFDTYAEGIETVAKALVKYYLNPQGTLIYEGEKAKGSYYTEPTVAGVNVRYASDTNWHNKVYSYMQYLYNRL